MISHFVAGCIFLGFMIVAGHFFKFWRSTRDRFFLFFAIAFFLFGVEKFCVGLFIGSETVSSIYIVRLIASGFILAAIIDKNRG
jgi:hypothetical protein